MKALTLKQVALIVASSALAVFIIFTFIISLLGISPHRVFLPSLIAGLVLFSTAYFVSLYFIEKFIYRRIKIIYKTIHSLKVKNSFTEHAPFSNDILSQVNLDVLEWAQNNKKEIEDLKNVEEYRKEFIGNVAHELKTPIFNIQGY
ncbi:MAG: sensor histidine kinase, partial [Bacteroidetes bacterium]|nr:sensor histidine kinase [Bacteroidota bacterium]